MNRRSGDGRRKANSEDIRDLWVYLDSVKVPLPTFVAANLKRVADSHVADTDLCCKVTNVVSVKNQLNDLMDKMAIILDLKSQVVEPKGSWLETSQAHEIRSAAP